MDVVFGKYWLSQCFDAKGELHFILWSGFGGMAFGPEKGASRLPQAEAEQKENHSNQGTNASKSGPFL